MAEQLGHECLRICVGAEGSPAGMMGALWRWEDEVSKDKGVGMCRAHVGPYSVGLPIGRGAENFRCLRSDQKCKVLNSVLGSFGCYPMRNGHWRF